MNKLADNEQASKDAAMLAAEHDDDGLVVDGAWDEISGSDDDKNRR